jgi:hypothetical protein
MHSERLVDIILLSEYITTDFIIRALEITLGD